MASMSLSEISDEVVHRKVKKRPHRKSRKGCINCKRRKVKCDEAKPTCANCLHFNIPCVSSEDQLPIFDHTLSELDIHTGDSRGSLPARSRGRGRPRKDWTILPPKSRKVTGAGKKSDSLTASHASPDSGKLAVTDIELLLHFTSSTAKTLSGSDVRDNPICKFWDENVPQIGLNHHFVLHLVLAVAGYHLALIRPLDSQKEHYRSLAKDHMSRGLAGFTAIFPQLDDSNCGAIYISSMLVCYCTLAAGPTSQDDLLVCQVGDMNPVTWLSLIHGVRTIRTTIDPAILYSGLMSPLGPGSDTSTASSSIESPMKVAYIDWEEPLSNLRRYLASFNNCDAAIYLVSLDEVILIYEATYGKLDGSRNVAQEQQFVFGWLYRLRDDFMDRLRLKRPSALLVLAYYCVLLRSMPSCWFVHGWTAHILTRLRRFMAEAFAIWLRWPMEQVGLDWDQIR